MKQMARFLFLLSVGFPVAAQVDLPSRETGQVRIITAGQEWELLNRVVTRLEAQTRFSFPRDVQEALVDRPDVINAYADPGHRVVIVTTGMVRFVSHNEGELACIVGHEMGHIIDRSCGPLLNHPSSKLDEILGGIFGGGQGATVAKGGKLCEQRADEIGLQFMAGAGYNPYDCASVLGRMAMLHGDTGVVSKWLFSSTHPLDWERITDLRRTLGRYLQRFPEQRTTTGSMATTPTSAVPADTMAERFWRLVQGPDGQRWRFRISEHSIYGERLLSDEERRAGDYDTLDVKKQGDKYSGVQRVRISSKLKFQSRPCQWNFAVEIGSVGTERMDGRWEGYPPGSHLLPGTCTWSSERIWEPVTWIVE